MVLLRSRILNGSRTAPAFISRHKRDFNKEIPVFPSDKHVDLLYLSM